MRVEFFYEDDAPHIYAHGVNEIEVEEVLQAPGLEWFGRNGTTQKIGKTSGDRYLQVVFIRQPEDTVFVITAYPPNRGAMRAYRRRLKRKE